MSVFIMTLVFGGIITCYVQTAYRAEWSGYSLAAQAQACQQLELAKCAVWDIQQSPVLDQIGNTNVGLGLPRKTANILDLPVSGTNKVWVTNTAYVKPLTISTNPAVSIYMVKVDTVWPFVWRNQKKYYTNTVADYYAPD